MSTFITHQKSTKTTAYSIKNQKRSKLRPAREMTVCASSRSSPRKTLINGSEAKKARLAVHDVSKIYVNTASHKYVAKPESQQREELHIRTLQTATPFSSSASVSLEQSINTFSEGNIKQTRFHI